MSGILPTLDLRNYGDFIERLKNNRYVHLRIALAVRTRNIDTAALAKRQTKGEIRRC
jgi:hypothetical protein